MRICRDCKQTEHVYSTTTEGEPICNQCSDRIYKASLLAKGDEIKNSYEFCTWRSQDLAQLFWLHLALYNKDKNIKSFEIIKRVFFWAVHADQSLSTCIRHALKWCKIELLSLWK